MNLKFEVTGLSLALTRMSADARVPVWASDGRFSSVTRTAEELSIVCETGSIPPGIPCEAHWACLKIAGPIPLNECGVLDAFIAPLVDSKIPVFVISTFDTDYILVREPFLNSAIESLRRAGHEITTR